MKAAPNAYQHWPSEGSAEAHDAVSQNPFCGKAFMYASNRFLVLQFVLQNRHSKFVIDFNNKLNVI